MISTDMMILLPELLLAGFAMSALLFGVYTGKDGRALLLTQITALAFVLLAVMIMLRSGDQRAFDGVFIDDAFSRLAKTVILLSAALVLYLSADGLKRSDIFRFEYPILVSLAVVGMMMMVSSGDLMGLYMGLELQSLALYVLAAFNRNALRSTEAGMKYFVLGALSSGLLLYGASLLYGFAGTTRFSGIAEIIRMNELGFGVLFGLVFVLTGLAFKVSAAPFHMWTPDVYEGAPTPVTALFATAPKVAAMMLLMRVLFDAFGSVTAQWGQIIAFLSFMSMFVGAIAAIGQSDIKRLMAYSSIAHMGFALMGVASGTEAGVSAAITYMMIYVTMNVGVFAFIMTMRRDGQLVSDIASLGLYSKQEPGRAAALAVLMFSLAGIPPLMGFIGKLYVLQAAVDAGMTWLALAGVIASVIGAFYYLRVVYILYFGAESEALDAHIPVAHLLVLMLAAALMLLGMINLFGLEPLIAQAAQSLLA